MYYEMFTHSLFCLFYNIRHLFEALSEEEGKGGGEEGEGGEGERGGKESRGFILTKFFDQL
jgi:hypothetical protein